MTAADALERSARTLIKMSAGQAITHELHRQYPPTRPVLIGQGKPNPSSRFGKRLGKNNFHLQDWVRILI